MRVQVDDREQRTQLGQSVADHLVPLLGGVQLEDQACGVECPARCISSGNVAPVVAASVRLVCRRSPLCRGRHIHDLSAHTATRLLTLGIDFAHWGEIRPPEPDHHTERLRPLRCTLQWSLRCLRRGALKRKWSPHKPADTSQGLGSRPHPDNVLGRFSLGQLRGSADGGHQRPTCSRAARSRWFSFPVAMTHACF